MLSLNNILFFLEWTLNRLDGFVTAQHSKRQNVNREIVALEQKSAGITAEINRATKVGENLRTLLAK